MPDSDADSPLVSGMKSRRTCFVAMPIATPNELLPRYSNDKDHFKHVLEHLFVPAIEASNLTAISPITAGSPVIHSEIIRQISDADLVLCDMSNRNANVFFELGIRTALDRPVCLVQDAFEKNVPFDLNLVNYHTYDASLAPWTLDDEIAAVQRHLAATLSSGGEHNAMWQVVALKRRAEAAIDPGDPVAARLTLLENQVRALTELSQRRTQPHTDTHSPTGTLVGRRILWVDDAPENNLSERRYFEANGVEVITAESTTDAIEALREQDFDLILSDIGRIEEGRDNPSAGYEFLQQVREDLGIVIPLIFYTGNAAKVLNNRIVRKYRSSAADKPDELIKLVTSELSRV